MTRPDDNLTIAPATAPLSQSAKTAAAVDPTGRLSPERRTIVFALSVAMLVALAALVFIVVPQWIDPPEVAATVIAPGATTTETTSTTAAASSENAEIVAPYRAVELERARQKAQAELGRFVELQMQLEDEMDVEAWGAQAYAAVKDRANQADELFVKTDYEQALAEYAGALADLEAVVEQGRAVHDDAVTVGFAAIAARDAETAAAEFQRALAIINDSAQALAGAERAAKLPQVLDYLREAERALLQEDLDRANDYLRKAKQLDPATEGVEQQLAEVADRRAEARYQALLSEGFRAMEAGQFDAAERAFEQVLKSRPNDSVAAAGIQQNAAKRTLGKINTLHTEALALEDAGQFAEALAKYDAALAIDKTLQFARDGRNRTRSRVAVYDAMRKLIRKPGVLSSDNEFTKASALLEKARAVPDAGAAFDATVAEFTALLEIAAAPVPLVIVSDNATQIMIQRIGVLGTFERHEVSLRPGNYIIVGSRDGCRDVRKEILLTPAMPPVAIRCEERI